MKKYYVGLILILLLAGLHFDTVAQNQGSMTVKGKVSTLSGPLPGVSIQVKGTQTGTLTDDNGEYSIQVNDSTAILVLSYVGYVTEEIAIRGRAVLDEMFLIGDISTLSEIVVVGYGTQEKKDLTSSIINVKPEDLNRGAISDVGQLLQGKVPGLNISRSGDPNRPAAIILRGASSLREGAQSPLFVIDGVIGADIALIAPDDIASIDVLKDASAAAIYGNRGANGVIMITTRRPTKGSGQLSYSGYVGFDKVSNKLKVMDGNQLRDFWQKNSNPYNPVDDTGANTNWQSSVQRSTAVSTNHNLSLSGGSDKTSYVASLNYFSQEGIIKNSGLKRIIARMAVDQKVFRDKLDLGFTVSNSFSDANNVPYRNTVLAQMLTYLPTVPVRNGDGTYFNFRELSNASNHNNDHNPVAMLESATERPRNNIFLGSFKAQLQLPFNLKYNAQASYQALTTNYGAYYNKYFTDNFQTVRSTPDPPGNPTPIVLMGVQDGQAVRSAYKNTTVLLENFFSWDKDFGLHTINAVLGYSWQQNITNDGFASSSSNFPSDDLSYNNLTLGNPYANSNYRVDFGQNQYDQTRLISNFVRVKYDYNGRYLFQLSVRKDGSSAFGKNHRWGNFPSAAVAWRISKEAFMENVSVVSDLKLRASYGISGNSAGFYGYTTKRLFGLYGSQEYNGQTIQGVTVTQNENPDLRWEKTATTNFGLDFGILNDRIRGSFDVYDKRTTDLIWSYDVLPGQTTSNGINIFNSTFTANVGEVSNKGYEIALDASVLEKSGLTWNTSLNVAHNQNKLETLTNSEFKRDTFKIFNPDGPGQSGQYVQALISGQPIGTFYTLKYAGKDDSGVSQFVLNDGTLVTNPLSFKNSESYQVVGNAQPKLLLGWNNNFRYKNFDLNFFIRGVFGNKILNVTRADLFRPGNAHNNNILADAASESAADGNANFYSSRFVEDGTYVRFDNATLGYNFKKLGTDIKKIRLYVSVNNLFVITKYKGIDPEINQGGLAPGIDARNFYPKMRTFLIGVSASF